MAEHLSDSQAPPPVSVEHALHAFATALQRLTVYPEEHPQTADAIRQAYDLLSRLLEQRESVHVVAAADRLEVDDKPLETAIPALRELPLRLQRRDVGSIRFERGLERDEFSVLLRAIARREERDAARGSTPPRQVALPHAQLFPLRVASVALGAGQATVEPAPVSDAAEAAPRAADADEELWERMVTLAAASNVEGAGDSEPGVMVERLRERLANEAEVVACAQDVLALLAHAARSATPTRRRIVDTVAALSDEEIGRVVSALPDAAARRAFVEHAARGLPAETTVAAARAAAATGALPLTDASVLLLQKLAAVAEVPTARGRARAEAALRRHLEDLIADCREAEGPPLVRDPAPSLESVLVDEEWAPRGAPKPSWAARLARMGAELDADVPGVHAAIEVVAESEESTLVSLARSADASTAVGMRVRTRAFTEDALATLLESAEDEPSLGHVAEALGPAAVPALVSALLERGPRTRTYRIARVLARFGEAGAREACARMVGAPRYVQRTVLTYLRAIGIVPEDFPLARYARHPDAGVRAAAVRLQLALPDHAPGAAHDALLSGDAHLVRLAVRWFAHAGADPDSLPLLLEILRTSEQPSAVRALAAQAVQESDDLEVLETLLEVTTVRGRLLRRPRLAPLAPHVVASLHVLARRWGAEPRAREVLDLALELGALVPRRRTPSFTPRVTPPVVPARS